LDRPSGLGRRPDKRIGQVLRELSILATALMVFQISAGQAMSHSNCDPLRTAKQYIAKRFPWFDSTGMKLVISEKGHLWEMTYKLPPNMLGGAPIITIDKRTCKIVRAVHEQ
jgi:hypothetical protein